MSGENGNNGSSDDVGDDDFAVDDDHLVDDDADSGHEITIAEDVEPVSFTDVDNVGDISVEINVEELVANIEAGGDDDSIRGREIKRRLEEAREQRDAEESLGGTYNFNLDDDL